MPPNRKGAFFVLCIVFFFWLTILASTITSPNKFYTFIYSIIYIPVIIISYRAAIQYLDSKINPLTIAPYIFSASIVISLVGYLVFNDFYTIEAGVKRLHGVFGEPAKLATICALNIGLLAYTNENAHLKHLKYLLILLSFICLILTGTRAGLIAVSGAILFIFSLGQRQNWKAYILLFCLFAFSYLAYTQTQSISNRLLKNVFSFE